MTAPNLRYASTIVGNTALYAVTTTLSTALTNAAASNKVFKVNSIFCANITSATPADISVSIYNGSLDFYIARNITVPGSSTLMVGTKESYVYLLEGWSIKAIASTNSNLSLVISYEEIS